MLRVPKMNDSRTPGAIPESRQFLYPECFHCVERHESTAPLGFRCCDAGQVGADKIKAWSTGVF
jgi:hypothetical protein